MSRYAYLIRLWLKTMNHLCIWEHISFTVPWASSDGIKVFFNHNSFSRTDLVMRLTVVIESNFSNLWWTLMGTILPVDISFIVERGANMLAHLVLNPKSLSLKPRNLPLFLEGHQSKLSQKANKINFQENITNWNKHSTYLAYWGNYLIGDIIAVLVTPITSPQPPLPNGVVWRGGWKGLYLYL